MKNTKNTVKRVLGILMVITTLFLAAVPAFAKSVDTRYLDSVYVNCENGKRLNLRETPNGTVIGRLDCGTEVYVLEHLRSGWTEVLLKNGKSGYVMTKFLQEKKPGKYEITEREDNFRAVRNPYTVTAKALNKNTEKSVGLRVKPNKTAKAIRTLYAGDELEVLAVGKTWLKVRDLDTGRTGYVAKDYVE